MQSRVATGVAALAGALRQRLTGRPRAPTPAQVAEATRQAQAAARREAADEAMRATSRRVMREMWPPRPAGKGHQD